MGLTRSDRERINDSRLKLRTVSETLEKVDTEKVPDFEDIQECLEGAEKSLKEALRADDRVD